ncbi:MAG: PIN domain-containing protein [Candidatus Helarchaeota archaeon]
MRFVIDANILLAALIKKSVTADLLTVGNLALYAPEFLLEEFRKYEDLILKKTHRSLEEFQQFLGFIKRRIKFVPIKNIVAQLEKATLITPDPKDTVYLALALTLDARIWSNDKRLKKKQNIIPVFNTSEIIELLNVDKNNTMKPMEPH